MKMRSILWVGILALAAAAPVLIGQGAAIRSVWAAQPPKVDGASKDWEGQALFEAEKGGVQYALRNDGNNL